MDGTLPNPLQRRVESLEAELRLHERERLRLERLLAEMTAIVESQQAANRHLQERVQLQRVRVEAAERSIAGILNSRAWRLLAAAGGVALRAVGHRLPPPMPVLEAVPVPESVEESAVEFESTASEHAPELETEPARPTAAEIAARTLPEWEEILRAIAVSLPPPTVPPRICFLTPTFNTKPAWLAEAALSVFAQTCPDWEWRIVDDGSTDQAFFPLLDLMEKLSPRVRVERCQRGGISAATNVALARATAPYIACLDHDDVMAPSAAERCLEMLSEGYDAVYTDSDKIDEASVHSEPFYKPDWSPEYLRGAMYVGHLLVVRRDLTLEIGGFHSEFDGCQDFEFLLRYADKGARIGHVSELLYHWRKVAGSVATAQNAKGDKVGELQQRAVQQQLDRSGLPARAEPGGFPHRVRVAPLPRTTFPKVSIIIPTRDAPAVLEQCLRSIFSLSTYPNYEVLLADNDTSDPDALAVMRRFPVGRLYLPGPFHFARCNNLAARETDGDFLLFANNDIEVLTPGWIEQMLFYAEQPRFAAVGALLLYPNQTVQHAGVVLGCRGTADHVSRGIPGDCDGYAGSLSCAREVSAVTAACLMIGRDRFEAVGGFNEHFFTAYQDVDLCLRLRAAGYASIFTPQAKLLHHESYSRGSYYDFTDRYLLLDQWQEMISGGDPYFNRHFDLTKIDYTLA